MLLTTKRRDAEVAEVLETLTPHEAIVLEFFVAGATNEEIADYLGMSVRTVHLRRTSLQLKFGAEDRAELVRIKVRHDTIVELTS